MYKNYTLIMKGVQMDNSKLNQLYELEALFRELFEFYFGEHGRLNKDNSLNEEEIKHADKIRRKIKKTMSNLYEGYYPSTGGFSKANYTFMFNNKKDANKFANEIILISKLYKRYFIDELNEKNYRVKLNIFLKDEDFFDKIDSLIGFNF